MIDGLYVIWNEIHREEEEDDDSFDVWLKTMEGHTEIEEGLYIILESAEEDAAEGNKNKYVYVEE